MHHAHRETGQDGGRPAGLCVARLPEEQLPREEYSADRPLQILHLEDSPSDSELAGEHIAADAIPASITRVETREQFQAALAAGGIDLIIADFQLPAFDGITAFLLAHEMQPEIPFIMLTGKLGEEYAIDTLKLGVTDYVLKQSMARLGPAVQRALAERRERVQRRDAQAQLRRYQEHLEELVRLRTAELEERNAQLAAANADLETLVAAVSHDLRTPLVVIGGFARRLQKNCAGSIAAADAELLEKIVRAGAGMERLIADLLAFFRASQTAPQRLPIDMADAVRETFAELRPVLEGRRVELALSPLPDAYGDPAMVRQVLANLLENAAKYTASRDAALIEVRGWEDPDATGYCVSDNGIGFDMGASARLFEPFQRLHAAPEFPGTGVGLATVKRIVERHGGRVWATAAVGAGASFYFTLTKAPAGR
jgi:signal transduction histidine kinase